MFKYKLIVIHHSASPLTTTVEEIREWHIARGFDDIGYHYVILANGDIKYGRSLRTQGAHSRERGIGNREGIGICAVGNNLNPDQMWTNEQKVSLRNLVSNIKALVPDLIVLGHKELADARTECPGLSSEGLQRIINESTNL